MDGSFPLTVTTFFGLEGVLAEEMRRLGAADVAPGRLAVTARGDTALLYRLNLCLRAGLRVLQPLRTFTARGDRDLYDAVRAIRWRDHLDVRDTLAVDSTVNSEHFRHSQYASQRVKDAIVDQFRDDLGRRPSVDTESPSLRLNLHVNGDRCTLSRDSSGESLHRRGYRAVMGPAQLNEVLAAGLVLLSGWDGKANFVDPMCGSGTLAIEAALIAGGIAPGKFRKRFGFMGWKDYNAELFEKVKVEVKVEEEKEKPKPIILAADKSPAAVHAAGKNAESAGLKGRIRFSGTEFEKLEPPEGPGTAVLNPPYGERMGAADLHGLYKSIGDTLKKKYQGYEAWIISANREALKGVGLRPSRRATVHNGGLECRFQRYSMYAGSVKRKHVVPVPEAARA